MKTFFRPAAALLLVLSLLLPSAAALEVEDARWLLDTYYVEEIPEEILALDTLEEILAALGDPYTEYLDARMLAYYLGEDNGEYLVGIGITTSTQPGPQGLKILSVFPDTPAAEAGLVAGDIILSIDGTDLTPDTSLLGLFARPAGTPITLRLQRADSGLVETVRLTPRPISIPIAYFEVAEGAPLITCMSFYNETAVIVYEALTSLEGLGRPWVVDLRYNPGGTVSSAANAVAWFTGGDSTAAYLRDRDGFYLSVDSTWNRPDLTDRPIILLTGADSASAAELFSAAARDYQLGIAVGERTYGKGVAQVLFDDTVYPEFFDGDSLKITAYRFFSPAGLSNDMVGILPALSISGENARAVGLLLAEAGPNPTEGYGKLALAGYDFYFSLEKALSPDYRSAFIELLEALPPDARLFLSLGGAWSEYEPQALAASLGLPFQSRGFTDIDNSFAQRAIRLLASHYLVGGYGDGTFRPQAAITRGEFSALLANALALPAVEGPLPFSDLPADDWRVPAVSALYHRGYLSGYEDGTFRPDAPITGQELVSILSGVARRLTVPGVEADLDGLAPEKLEPFAAYDPWARPAAWLLADLDGLDLRQGPQEPATRESAAQLLCTFLEAVGFFWGDY